MGRPRRPQIVERDLKGFKYFRKLLPLLERLQAVGTARDRAGNRQLFFDQYAALVLFYFFNPIITSMRALVASTRLEKVQRLLAVRPTSLGSFSEATEIFQADHLREILRELAGQAIPLYQGREAQALQNLCAVDGTILRALPQMTWALWKDEQHRGVKVHLHFDVLKAVPVDATLTAAIGSESEQLRQMLQPNRLYVLDRGYLHYELYRRILDANSSFVGRVTDQIVSRFTQELPLTEAAADAGVVQDLRLDQVGCYVYEGVIDRPLRLVIVRRRKPDGTIEELRLLTDRFDLPAELVALAYRYRWTVELFFRWFKCVLGCRHLLSTHQSGVAIQVYAALIASLLLVLWTGCKPNKRTWEMILYYLMGWATLEELEAHLNTPLPKKKPRFEL